MVPVILGNSRLFLLQHSSRKCVGQELRSECKKVGRKVAGVKCELLDRLKEPLSLGYAVFS